VVSQSFVEAAMTLAGQISEKNLSSPGTPSIDISLG